MGNPPLNDVLPLCWMSIYSLRIDQPPAVSRGFKPEVTLGILKGNAMRLLAMGQSAA